MLLALFGIVSGLAAEEQGKQPGGKQPGAALSWHYWGRIIEVKKVSQHEYDFTIEGRRVLVEEKRGAVEEERARELARVIEQVGQGPHLNLRKFRFCCVDEKTKVWLREHKPGHCHDLKKGEAVLVRSRGYCPKHKPEPKKP